MKVAYKYRIYPDKEQQKLINQMLFAYNIFYNIGVDVVKTSIVRTQRAEQTFSKAKDENGKIIKDENGEDKLFPKYKYPSAMKICTMIYHLKDKEDCENWQFVTSKNVLENKDSMKELMNFLPSTCASYIGKAMRTAIDQKFNKKIAKRQVKKKDGTFKKPILFTIDDIEEVDRTNLYFHKFNFNDCSFTCQIQNQTALKPEEGKRAYFQLPKVGLVKLVYHREIPKNTKFDAVTVSKENDEYYIVLGGLTLNEKPMIDKKDVENIVGVDVNTNNFIVTSDNDTFINDVEKIKKLKLAIKKIQQRNGEDKADSQTKSKRKYKSKNYKKKLLTLRKKETKIKRIKDEMLNTCTSRLSKKYDAVVIEDLNVKAMQKYNGKMVQKNNFFEFKRQLEYKCQKEGTVLTKIDRFFPSSQTCSKCGKIHTEMKNLNRRVFRCECGNIIGRDLNSAINIKNEGKKLLTKDL